MSFPPPGPPPPPYYDHNGFWTPPPPTSYELKRQWEVARGIQANERYPSYDHHPTPPYPYFVPGTMMVPVPMPLPENQPTYITNYIYHGETSNQRSEQEQLAEPAGDFDWVPSTATTASTLTGKAIVGGREGWDGSPLWIIRARHNGELVPGKLSVRHNAASITNDGKEIPVYNIEVLCSKSNQSRWVPASGGSIPPGAIPGGNTSSSETLYIGRASHQLSLTPGKVDPTHGCCYVGFGGAEITYDRYDVLCRKC